MSAAPLAPAQLRDLALAAIAAGLAEPVMARLNREVPAQHAGDASLWQALALACRAAQDSGAAHRAFGRAAKLNPTDRMIAHGLAQTALEAGFPASALFATARRLSPRDPQIIIGEASARLDEGDGVRARGDLARALTDNPGWIDGHIAYARLTAFSAPQDPADATLVAAIAAYPQDWTLRAQAIRIALEARGYGRAATLVDQARATFGDVPELQRIEAICLSETGEAADAQRIFDRLPPPPGAATLIAPIRNLVRLGRYDAAMRLAETRFAPPEERVLWPYRALLWRRADDPRWAWLEGDERLIQSYDLGGSHDDWAALQARLDTIHGRSGEHLDQSVRGGSQTDGDLFARAEPEIRLLRARVVEAVHDYIGQLRAPVAGHPTLIERREPLRIAGSWSVRLQPQGFHVDHTHVDGWLSSACYIALPPAPAADGDACAGWLTFGEVRDLMPDLPAFRTIEPAIGRLMLFPSLTWHGTRRFTAGERLTVAFDVAMPD